MTSLCCIIALVLGYCIGRTFERATWVREARSDGAVGVFRGLSGYELYWVGADQSPCERCGCKYFRPECYCCKRYARPWQVEAQA